jgi:PleD family two-component response regulator
LPGTRRKNQLSNRGYDITFSAGVVDIDLDVMSIIDNVLDVADTVMYENKAQKIDAPKSS